MIKKRKEKVKKLTVEVDTTIINISLLLSEIGY